MLSMEVLKFLGGTESSFTTLCLIVPGYKFENQVIRLIIYIQKCFNFTMFQRIYWYDYSVDLL